MFFFFFFNDTATTEIYTLSLHDALPIFSLKRAREIFEGFEAFPSRAQQNVAGQKRGERSRAFRLHFEDDQAKGFAATRSAGNECRVQRDAEPVVVRSCGEKLAHSVAGNREC